MGLTSIVAVTARAVRRRRQSIAVGATVAGVGMFALASVVATWALMREIDGDGIAAAAPGGQEPARGPAPARDHDVAAQLPADAPEPAPAPAACSLSWEELATWEPAKIPLRTWSSAAAADDDLCPDGFDARAVLAKGGCKAPDCLRADLGHGRRGALVVAGPGGSGRYWQLGLALDGPVPSFACTNGSTVGWRHLYRVADMLAPLPWLDDVDGDHRPEVIVWVRLPWGNSEYENGMVPAIYRLEGGALVRHDELGVPLARRVAAAYRRLSALAAADRDAPDDDIHPHETACYDAIARALDRWDRHP